MTIDMSWFINAVNWLFNFVLSIGGIPHPSAVWLDVVLFGAGALMIPGGRRAGRAGSRMYKRIKTGVKGLQER